MQDKTPISKEIIFNPNLSSKAFKVFCYIAATESKNNEKHKGGNEIMRCYFKEGRDALRKGVKELIEAGLIEKTQTRDRDNKVFSFNDYKILKS